MNRKYTSTEYLKIIENVRKGTPNIALSSDFIVGFPGETRNDFKDTIKLVKEVNFAHAYSFKYSKRIGTKASRIDCNITEEEKNDRLQELQAILRKQKKTFNSGFVGKELEIFFKGKSKKNNQYRGTTKWMQNVIFNFRDSQIDKVYNVKVKNAYDNCLTGELV